MKRKLSMVDSFVRYGMEIRLRHKATGAYLKSLNKNYSHPGNSSQQMVVGGEDKDADSVWIIKGSHENAEANLTNEVVHNGNIIRLEHLVTRKNLHSHEGRPSPVTSQQEVTCYGDAGMGDINDNWIVALNSDTSWTLGYEVYLIHQNSQKALHSHGDQSHPIFTNGNQEVTALAKNDDNDLWECLPVETSLKPNDLKSVSIVGLRSFGKAVKIEFAQPNGHPGSGLTILTGANNAGKSTILEALSFFNNALFEYELPQDLRNGKNHLRVALELELNSGSKVRIASLAATPSKVKLEGKTSLDPRFYHVPARRTLDRNRTIAALERAQHMQQSAFTASRLERNSWLSQRLDRWEGNRPEINALLEPLLGKRLSWNVDTDGGRNSRGLQIRTQSSNHSADGIGEGTITLFHLVDALYDLKEGEVIIIDEPELSLNPFLQRKIFILLMKYSATNQIIIATHSPHFIEWEALSNGAILYRVHIENDSTSVTALPDDATQKITGINNCWSNPHVFGLEAKEIFFLPDRVIVCEGQEDVVLYRKFSNELGIGIGGTFFGWGAGSVSNIRWICQLLSALKYDFVACVLDRSDKNDIQSLIREFPKYHFIEISTEDVRDKDQCRKEKGRCVSKQMKGLASESGVLKESFKDEVIDLFKKLNLYLSE